MFVQMSVHTKKIDVLTTQKCVYADGSSWQQHGICSNISRQ